MIRRSAQLLVLVVASMLAMCVLVTPASADPYTNPSVDPNSADFSPVAWNNKWSNGADKPAGDVKTGLQAMGLISASMPQQAAALTPDDLATLDGVWQDKELLFDRFTQLTRKYYATAVADPTKVLPFSEDTANYLANWVNPKTSYADLSPGLKSIVHQMAIILTGANRPAMPDDSWASWMTPEQRSAYDAAPSTQFDWTKADKAAAPSLPATPDCPQISVQCGVQNAAGAGIDAVTGAVDFLKDPFGWIGAKMAAGAAGLWGWIAGLANSGTAPDLSTDWWISAYQKAMAVGIVLALIVLLYQFVQLSMGKISGRELFDTLWLWTPAYLAGIVFGPALGQFFAHGAVALTDGIVQSFSGFSAGETDTQMKAAFEAAGSGKALGGIFVGIFVLIFAVIGSVVLFCSLALQLIAIYLSAALFPVGFAWVVSVRHRGGSYKIPFLFLALLFARPALFFLLGIGLAAMNKAMTFGDEGAQNLANLLFGVGVMVLAAFAPFLLLKHAPVSPAGWQASGGGGGGAVAAGAGAAAAGGSAVMNLANRRAARPSPTPSTRGGSSPAGGGSGSSAAAGAVGGGGAPAGGAPGAGRVAGSVPGGARRGSALAGGPPSAAGWRLARDTGQPVPAGAAPAGAAGKPSAGSAGAGPSPSRPGGSSAPGRAARSSAAGAAPPSGGDTAGAAAAGRSSQGSSRPTSGSARSSRWGGATRRAGRSSGLSPRGLVEGADGDQQWDSLR